MVVSTVTPQFINLDVELVTDFGADIKVVEQDVRSEIAAFVATLSPGQSLIIARLVDIVMELTGVKDVRFFERDSTDRAANIDTIDSRHALRINADSLKLISDTRE